MTACRTRRCTCSTRRTGRRCCESGTVGRPATGGCGPARTMRPGRVRRSGRTPRRGPGRHVASRRSRPVIPPGDDRQLPEYSPRARSVSALRDPNPCHPRVDHGDCSRRHSVLAQRRLSARSDILGDARMGWTHRLVGKRGRQRARKSRCARSRMRRRPADYRRSGASVGSSASSRIAANSRCVSWEGRTPSSSARSRAHNWYCRIAQARCPSR